MATLMNTIEWEHEPAIGDITYEVWNDEKLRFQIFAHLPAGTPDHRIGCGYWHCPKVFRDLNHFVMIDYRQNEKRSYAFELEVVKQWAEARLLRGD